jgi:uncharacterized membrane protein YgcG
MRLFFVTLLLICLANNALYAQEYFTIKQYNVAVKINKDASLDITETINVHFTEPRHGIFRMIPFKYSIQSLPDGMEKAERQMESNGYAHTFIEDIEVEGWNYSVSEEWDYKKIKIGSANQYVDGDQQYIIHYKLLNAINFFKDRSELYFNVIGDKWPTTIEKVTFSIELYDVLPATPDYFVATGFTGSRNNNSTSTWSNNKIFSGNTIQELHAYQGVTIGIVFPKDFLIATNYNLRGINWLALPCVVLLLMFLIWRKWGKDERVTVQTEFYPPADISPSVAGYIIDDKLDRRDLTALIPYWGAGGYLHIKEIEKSALLGIIKNKDYEFTKLKELPENVMIFERTLFKGIFSAGKVVTLSSLKNVLYVKMNNAKRQLEAEVDKGEYYTKYSRGFRILFVTIAIISFLFGGIALIAGLSLTIWMGLAFIGSGIIIALFGAFMPKKSKKGNEVYQKLAGFKEFIKLVEKDKLQEFLKQDEHYFDKVLPFAIVFGMADKWKDKLSGLDIPPPSWYTGNYVVFSAANFMNSLDHSMNAMSTSFYSAPSSSGSSGGSWSGGGGFSGGGFGGGGGGSW